MADPPQNERGRATATPETEATTTTPGAEMTRLGWIVVGVAGGVAAVVLVTLVTLASMWIRDALRPTNAGLIPAAYKEWMEASTDPSTIVDLAGWCKSRQKTGQLSVSIPTSLLSVSAGLTTMPRGAFAFDEKMAPKLDTPSYLLAAVTLSNDIARSRVDIVSENIRDYITMQVLEWIFVGMGAITTILIAIKTMGWSVRSHAYLAVGIAAIISSSLGTATGALINFYTPRITYQRSSHALANLRVLHHQLVEGIARQGQICEPMSWPKDWKLTRIRTLADRYAAIMEAAQAEITTAEAASSEGEDSTPGKSPSTK